MGTGFLILILNPFCPHWLFATLILIILSVKKLHSLCIGSFRYIPFSIPISAFYELNQTTIKLFPVSGLLFGLYSSSIVLEFQRPYMGILPLFFFNDIAKSLYLLCLVYWCHGSSQSPISSPYCILFFIYWVQLPFWIVLIHLSLVVTCLVPLPGGFCWVPIKSPIFGF